MARIYVDEIRDYGSKGKWCHMWTPDGTDRELDAFARLLGLKKSWAHTSHGLVGRFYHYDLRPSKRKEALGFPSVCSEKSLAEWIREVGMDEKKRKYKVEKCGVCNHVFAEQADHLECPTCHMRYDCIEGKSDNSDVMISPMDCNHRNRLFVQGMRDSNGGNENVTICADCGEMVITGQTVRENGFFRVRVMLPSDELVTAIGRWARLIKAEGKRGE